MNDLQNHFDPRYMRMAIELALKGTGQVNPNPLVGAVIVKNGQVIGSGYHTAYGKLHAEREAFKSLKDPADAEGADLYVTLEPCCHQGKQPPCTDAIISHKIRRVFVGSADPNPLVAGKGNQILRDHGIEVYEDCLREECDRINEIFLHYIRDKKPYVMMKYAMTLDGKIATVSGKSRWITGPAARKKVHEDRNRMAAIMVGIGTVLTDDPMLNCRLDEFESVSESGTIPESGQAASEQTVSHPVRIVCDSKLRIPLDSKLVKTARDIPVIVATARQRAFRASSSEDSSEEQTEYNYLLSKDTLELQTAKNQLLSKDLSEEHSSPAFLLKESQFLDKKSQLESLGVKVISIDPDPEGHVDLKKLVEILGKQEKIDSILLEGGARLHESALKAGIVDKVQVYIAPKIFGGKHALSPVGGRGVDHPDQAYRFTEPEITRLGEDILLESYLIKDRDTDKGTDRDKDKEKGMDTDAHDSNQSSVCNTQEQEVSGTCLQES